MLGHVYEAPCANMKMECQRWPEMPLILGRSGTQYVAMVIELLSSYWKAHLVESYCKVLNISDTNWLRYLFSSYLNKFWLSVWRHHLANLHILKTRISLERKEIFENSKQHFSSYEDYLFMFQNGNERCNFRHSTTLRIIVNSREKAVPYTAFQVFPDNFMRREVLAIIVHCTFMDDGCIWKGEVRHLEVRLTQSSQP